MSLTKFALRLSDVLGTSPKNTLAALDILKDEFEITSLTKTEEVQTDQDEFGTEYKPCPVGTQNENDQNVDSTTEATDSAPSSSNEEKAPSEEATEGTTLNSEELNENKEGHDPELSHDAEHN